MAIIDTIDTRAYRSQQPYTQTQTVPQTIKPVNHQGLPVDQIYESSKAKESDELKIFKRFLDFNNQLAFVERLEALGAININRPEQIVIEVEEERKPSFLKFCLGFFGIILIAIAIL